MQMATDTGQYRKDTLLLHNHPGLGCLRGSCSCTRPHIQLCGSRMTFAAAYPVALSEEVMDGFEGSLPRGDGPWGVVTSADGETVFAESFSGSDRGDGDGDDVLEKTGVETVHRFSIRMSTLEGCSQVSTAPSTPYQSTRAESLEIGAESSEAREQDVWIAGFAGQLGHVCKREESEPEPKQIAVS